MSDCNKVLDFLGWFDQVLAVKPGMLGSISDISAMFFIADNIRSILISDERLPHDLSWNEFLIEKNLLRNLKSVPIEDGWSYEKFVDLRCQYLQWVEMRRLKGE